jgi:acetyl-CoA C-acetyltransferase
MVNAKIRHFLKLQVPPRLFEPGDWPAQRADRPGGRFADGPDGRKPGLEIWHQSAGRWMSSAVCSHLRATGWRARPGAFSEIVPLVDAHGKVYAEDDGVRADASLAGMAKLKPFFDKKYGNITAANSSQITDGAAWLILASEEAVKKWQLKPLGKIVDSEWAGLDPALMGLGPVHASTPILQRHGLALNDIDAWELNEAFAAQVLGCQAAWQSDEYCREQLGLPAALGALDDEKLNVDGGAASIGHPVGASGARIVLHLLHVLRRKQLKRGIATICIGGGLGGAMLVESLELT